MADALCGQVAVPLLASLNLTQGEKHRTLKGKITSTVPSDINTMVVVHRPNTMTECCCRPLIQPRALLRAIL